MDDCIVAPVLESSCTLCTLRFCAPYAPRTPLIRASFARSLMIGMMQPRQDFLQDGVKDLVLGGNDAMTCLDHSAIKAGGIKDLRYGFG